VRQAVERFVREPAGLIGACLVFGILVVAGAAPILAPYSPIQQFPGNELAPPSARFLLGTDSIARDILSRMMFGSRVSLLVGVVAVALGAGVGGVTGLLAGYVQGRFDAVVMRLWDAVFAVPAILLGIAFAAAFRPSGGLAAVTLGIASMPTFARLARAGVLAESRKDYVRAARALGASQMRLLGRHILPNILGPIFVQLALVMAAAVVLEAGLSFLGLGVQPPEPSWGGMLAESRQYLRQAPWYGLFPGLSLTFLVLGLNFLADGLRDALDPRLSRWWR
jgi:peptide/nickel transport system permease protein